MSDHRHPLFARFWAVAGPRAMSKRDRAALLSGLQGDVVEVGAGDGLNFPFYPPDVARVTAVEPEPSLRARAAAGAPPHVRVVDGTAERLPVADATADAVVACLVLCSVTDQDAALSEVARVLKPAASCASTSTSSPRTAPAAARSRSSTAAACGRRSPPAAT
jgi:ubiquinone/menaquinone biosynthesis C-methylase UbiE